MTFAITIGRFGGFYVYVGYVKRICVGWIAFDIYPKELEVMNYAHSLALKAKQEKNMRRDTYD